MPDQRQSSPGEVRVSDGGRHLCDLPEDRIGPADYSLKQGWRRLDEDEIEREGWDYYKPNSGGSATNQKTVFTSTGPEVMSVFELKRGNGQKVHIAVGQGKVKWFDYANSQWVQVGSGYQTAGIKRWQVISVGPYAVFNNGVDLPFTYLVGDSATKPIYELREQGIASVGDIAEYYGLLLCSDLTEILAAEMAGVMTGGSPYGLVAANKCERTAYRQTWSNFGDPRDFAASVTGSISSGSPTLTLAWAMSSFSVGDELTILGAGTLGGNLVTTISAISGATITLAANAATTVSNADVQKTTALNTVVGYKDLDEDGSAITRQLSLDNRIVAYKEGGHIYVGYYTGDLDNPLSYECVYKPKGQSRGLVWPNTLIDVGGDYHLYAGANFFYKFTLSGKTPEVHPVFRGCAKKLFFDRIRSSDSSLIYSAMNGVTDEVFVAFTYLDGVTRKYSALAYTITQGRESIDEVTDFVFSSAATVHMPNGDKSVDEQVVAFLMGGYDGTVTLYGATSTGTTTRQRYGAAFTRVLEYGFSSLGDGYNEKVVRSWVPLVAANGAGGALTLKLYGANGITNTPSLLTTKTALSDGNKPGVIPLFFQRIYFKDRIECSAGTGVRFTGRIIDFGGVRSRSITRLAK